MEQCLQKQQFWLRQQRELVKKTQSLDEQTQSINTLQKEELILSQKKLRLDGSFYCTCTCIYIYIHVQYISTCAFRRN